MAAKVITSEFLANFFGKMVKILQKEMS